MRARRWLAAGGVVLVGVAVGPVATAAPPITTPVPFQETFTEVVGVCDFPVTVEFNTEQTLREWQGRDGEVRKSHTTGHGYVELTNETTGSSVRADASGPTFVKNGKSRGTGNWVLIGFQEDADVLPFPPGAWLYSGRIADLDAADYSTVFRGRIVNLCTEIS